MDTDLQALVDTIQNNQDTEIKFSDDDQQIAISVIDNDSGALIAAGGGRNLPAAAGRPADGRK